MRIRLMLPAVAVLVLAAAGCAGQPSASQNPPQQVDHRAELEKDCLEQVAAKVGIAVTDITVTDRIKNPAGSLDWRGTYPGGEWGCAGAMDAPELFSVIAYPV